jgi:hypothetical protein
MLHAHPVSSTLICHPEYYLGSGNPIYSVWDFSKFNFIQLLFISPRSLGISSVDTSAIVWDCNRSHLPAVPTASCRYMNRTVSVRLHSNQGDGRVCSHVVPARDVAISCQCYTVATVGLSVYRKKIKVKYVPGMFSGICCRETNRLCTLSRKNSRLMNLDFDSMFTVPFS